MKVNDELLDIARNAYTDAYEPGNDTEALRAAVQAALTAVNAPDWPTWPTVIRSLIEWMADGDLTREPYLWRSAIEVCVQCLRQIALIRDGESPSAVLEDVWNGGWETAVEHLSRDAERALYMLTEQWPCSTCHQQRDVLTHTCIHLREKTA